MNSTLFHVLCAYPSIWKLATKVKHPYFCHPCSRRFYYSNSFLHRLHHETCIARLKTFKTCTPFRQVGSSSTSINKEIYIQKEQFVYPEQQVQFYTCEDLYKRWRAERKFWCIPKSGVTVNVTYVDTSITESKEHKVAKDAPVVMCIHGIPGNYAVFSSLINYLSQHGVRVIVPNFPDSLYFPGKFKQELFRHSVEEKTQLFRDFLKTLNIPKIDCLVAHSSAIYPCLRLVLNDSGLQVNSQALFNTGGHRKTKTMSPYWLILLSSYVSLSRLGRKLVLSSSKPLLNLLRAPVKREYAEGLVLLGITMVFAEVSKTEEQFKEIAKRQLPTLLSFSEDDKIVEPELTRDVIKLLNGDMNDIWGYDYEAKLKKKGKESSWLKMMSFEAGSHYVFRKHPEVNNKAVLDLVRRVQKKS